jgi:RNA polymerase sigma factor (sigma-70 family)
MTSRTLTDGTLAARARDGDGEAFAELARRYRGLIGHVTRQPAFGLEHDDQQQEALLGLFEACRAYDPAKGRFGAIATVCLRRRVWNARLTARARKHRILTEAVGLDRPIGDHTTATIADRLAAPERDDPARICELRDELRQRAASAGTCNELRRLAPRRRRYTATDIALARSLVANGKTLREAAATVGATHPTVLRWLRNAA